MISLVVLQNIVLAMFVISSIAAIISGLKEVI